ncbi:MAG: hypothetical protein BV457_05430 [Thermoplasmata archaeon M9B1D]|nr:MAG: hypothetical protein BV457_05430 [Thermoplasmata archaeon M9B1D]PNX50257.1 MAG: hypothetical protein BV456_07280 [Thermoplasmata archaeon M8B2D]
MNEKIGFDCSQILMGCNSVDELDEAIRIINNMYRILREHLVVFDEIKNNNSINGNRICFLIGHGGKHR